MKQLLIGRKLQEHVKNNVNIMEQLQESWKSIKNLYKLMIPHDRSLLGACSFLHILQVV